MSNCNFEESLTNYSGRARHNLKIDLEYYLSISNGFKTFEIRKNDRYYREGDLLVLRPYCRKQGIFLNYPELIKVVTYITDYNQKDGYVVMALGD